MKIQRKPKYIKRKNSSGRHLSTSPGSTQFRLSIPLMIFIYYIIWHGENLSSPNFFIEP